jgi:hypothetical protein
MKFEEILKTEGLDHLIGEVRYEEVEGELRVHPVSEYATRNIGEGQYLGFSLK